VFDRLGWALDISERIGIWHYVVGGWYAVYTHLLVEGKVRRRVEARVDIKSGG
jgi:hypothetical protein